VTRCFAAYVGKWALLEETQARLRGWFWVSKRWLMVLSVWWVAGPFSKW
jgi:hypothetical protein